MKQFLKNILPINNRTEMSTALFVVKKILAFWLCYITGLFIAEGAIILLHFALGKNMLLGDVFDAQTIMLITYYGYIIISGVALLYWKRIEKKPLSKMGLTKRFGNYFIGAVLMLDDYDLDNLGSTLLGVYEGQQNIVTEQQHFSALSLISMALLELGVIVEYEDGEDELEINS